MKSIRQTHVKEEKKKHIVCNIDLLVQLAIEIGIANIYTGTMIILKCRQCKY
jgi:hypothetical protein